MRRPESFMRRALTLAERGAGRVSPNPMVGCVLVKAGRIVGEGFHRQYGGPHAEVKALKKAGAAARGATAYITLEPCSHFGKTPPCANALIAAGVERVVAAMRDPNPLVNGKGLARLKKAGVAVSTGLLEKDSQRLNHTFISRVSRNRPYVTLKAAVSLDGKMATSAGRSKWITGPAARAEGHKLRAATDAIMVGINTVVSDDPHQPRQRQEPHPHRPRLKRPHALRRQSPGRRSSHVDLRRPHFSSPRRRRGEDARRAGEGGAPYRS
jgi:diaminohydroxyphosphoribosylaminopyrimidine deaminase/5-amino-6-(5-phosphoribosylamino)uracil reductase